MQKRFTKRLLLRVDGELARDLYTRRLETGCTNAEFIRRCIRWALHQEKLRESKQIIAQSSSANGEKP